MSNIDTNHCRIAFGRYIKDIRTQKAMLQEEVAEKCGLAQSQYSRYERGEREIPLSVLRKICKVLGVSFDDFVRNYPE